MRIGGWLAAAVLACGPTAAEIKTAKEATYAASPQEVYAQAEQETAESYPIGERLPAEGVFATKPVWFTDHGRTSKDSDDAQREAGNMQVTFVVLVADAGDGTSVIVQASAVDHVAGKEPTTRELTSDSPELPGWIRARADKLRVAIHKRVQKLLDARRKPGSAAARP